MTQETLPVLTSDIQETFLVVTKAMNPEVILKNTDGILTKLEEEFNKFEGDATTAKGRKDIKSQGHMFSTSKTFLLANADAVMEKAKKTVKNTQKEKNRISAACDDYRDRTKQPAVDYDIAEQKKKDDAKIIIQNIDAMLNFDSDQPSVEEIEFNIKALGEIFIKDIHSDYSNVAEIRLDNAKTSLSTKRANRLQYDKDQVELETLRKEKIESDRVAKVAADKKIKDKRLADKKIADDLAVKKKEEREDKIKKDAADTAKKKAQDKAEADKKAAAKKAEDDKQEAIDRTQKKADDKAAKEKQDILDKAEKDKEKAVKKAVKETTKTAKSSFSTYAGRGSSGPHKSPTKSKEAIVHSRIASEISSEVGTETEISREIVKAVVKGKITNLKIVY